MQRRSLQNDGRATHPVGIKPELSNRSTIITFDVVKSKWTTLDSDITVSASATFVRTDNTQLNGNRWPCNSKHQALQKSTLATRMRLLSYHTSKRASASSSDMACFSMT